MQCAIWGTTAQVTNSATGDAQQLNSPRAGGEYWISGTAAAVIKGLSIREKKVLTTWLCDQRAAGVIVPKIDSNVLQFVTARRPLGVSERVWRTLKYLESRLPKLGAHILISFNDSGTANVLELLAATESEDFEELPPLLNQLVNAGLVEAQKFIGGGRYYITIEGHQRIEQVNTRKSDSTQVFVAMWFDVTMNEAFANGFEKAIYDSGYKALRIDQKQHNNKIDDEILAEIRRSRFVVADFTSEHEKVRGGVYFEAGFALGLDIPVIYTCRHDCIPFLHFDTRQYNHIVWSDNEDIYKRLKNRIGATIGDGPLLAKN